MNFATGLGVTSGGFFGLGLGPAPGYVWVVVLEDPDQVLTADSGRVSVILAVRATIADSLVAALLRVGVVSAIMGTAASEVLAQAYLSAAMTARVEGLVESLLAAARQTSVLSLENIMATDPIKQVDLHPAFSGANRNILLQKFPTELGAVEALAVTFTLWDAAGVTVLTKKSALAGGGISEISFPTTGAGGSALVKVAVDDTLALSGTYRYDIVAEGTVDGEEIRQVLAWGSWPLVQLRPDLPPLGQ